jgi:hypothetical protein
MKDVRKRKDMNSYVFRVLRGDDRGNVGRVAMKTSQQFPSTN